MAKRMPDDATGLPTGNEGEEPEPQQPAPEPESVAIDPFAVMAQLATAINKLAERQNNAEAQQTELMATLGAALARVADSNLKGSERIAEEMRRSQRPSNEIVPGISVFNQGGTMLEMPRKPPLKCIMFIPWVVEWESHTREEVELLNLLEPGTYTVTANDDDTFEMSVRAEYKVDGKTMSRLLMTAEKAFNAENHRRNLPLRIILREIIGQIPGGKQKMASILTEKEEAAMIAAGQLAVSV